MFDILPQLQETLHKQRVSVYKDLPTPTRKSNWKEKKVRVLFDNSYTAITEATHIPSDEIYKRLTFEQLVRWIDKLRYDSYATFDEGMEVNNMIKDESEIERIRDINQEIEDDFSYLNE